MFKKIISTLLTLLMIFSVVTVNNRTVIADDESYIYFQEGNGDDGYKIFNQITLGLNSGTVGRLYFHDGATGENTIINPSDVNVDYYQDFSDGAFMLTGSYELGEKTITYRDVTFTVITCLPDSGFYSSTERGEGSFIRGAVPSSDEDITLYLISKRLSNTDTVTAFEVQFEEGSESPNHIKYDDVTSTYVNTENEYSVFKVVFNGGVETDTQLEIYKGNIDTVGEGAEYLCGIFFPSNAGPGDGPNQESITIVQNGEYEIRNRFAEWEIIVPEGETLTNFDIRRNNKSLIAEEEETNNSYFDKSSSNKFRGRFESRGVYDLIVVTDATTYNCKINVINEDIFNDGFVLIDDEVYKFGVICKDEDNAIIFTGGTVIDTNSELWEYSFYIAAGEYKEGRVTGSASQEIINKVLANLSVRIVDEFDNPLTDVAEYELIDDTYSDKNLNTYNTKKIVVTLNEDNQDSFCLVLDTTIEGKTYSSRLNFIFNTYYNFDFNVDSLELGQGDTVLGKLNEILESKDSLNDFFKAHNQDNRDIDDNDRITFLLPGGETLTGVLTIDCANQEDGFEIQLRSENGFTTIKGGIKNYGGLARVNGINFVSNINDTDNENDVGLYSKDYDLWEVRGCNFEGYHRAIDSEGTGKISGINDCWFIDNEIGVYMNSTNSWGGSSSTNNTFINNNYSIYLNNIPVNDEPLNYSMHQNYFFSSDSDSYDYYVSENFEGVFYFTKNFFGAEFINNDLADSLKNSNVRNIRINRAQNNTIVTNPCVRYPEDPVNEFGIDPNGITKFVYGSNYSFHLNDLTNMSIGIADATGQNDLGKLVFGGND